MARHRKGYRHTHMKDERFATTENYIKFLEEEEIMYSLLAKFKSPDQKLCERRAKNRRMLRETALAIHAQSANN